MKRLVTTLIAGAFGTLLVLPMAHAQDYQDMRDDAHAIHQDKRDIHHDERKERRDVDEGRYGAAAREQGKIDEQRADERATKQDLDNDVDAADHFHHDDDRD